MSSENRSYSSQLPASAYASSSASDEYSSNSYSSSDSSAYSTTQQTYASQLPSTAYSSSQQTYTSQLPSSAYSSSSPSSYSPPSNNHSSYSSQLPSSAYSSSSPSSYSPPSNDHSSYSSQLPSSAYSSSQQSSSSHSYSSQLPSSAYSSSSSHDTGSYSPPQVPQSQQNYSSGYSPSPSSFAPPSGNKRALIIGINYFFNAEARLNGAVNDASYMRYLLISKFGFPERNILVLTDGKDSDEAHKPTKANIINAISWLTSGVKPGDSLFFSFSGHGSQTEDLDKDESDYWDETLLPVDYRTAGPIVDDDLHRMLAAPIPSGAKLTCIFDCCHSGTALDLPFTYNRGRFTSESTGVKKVTQGDVVAYSGCTDAQTASDSKYLGKMQVFSGVLTYALCQAIESTPVCLTYAALLESMQKFSAAKGFTQTLQFCSGKQFDVNTPFYI